MVILCFDLNVKLTIPRNKTLLLDAQNTQGQDHGLTLYTVSKHDRAQQSARGRTVLDRVAL